MAAYKHPDWVEMARRKNAGLVADVSPALDRKALEAWCVEQWPGTKIYVHHHHNAIEKAHHTRCLTETLEQAFFIKLTWT